VLHGKIDDTSPYIFRRKMKPTLNELQERKRVAQRAAKILESHGEHVSPPNIKIPHGYREITPRRSSRIASHDKRPDFIEPEPVLSPRNDSDDETDYYTDDDRSNDEEELENSSDEAVATLLRVSIVMCFVAIVVNPIIFEAFRVLYSLITPLD